MYEYAKRVDPSRLVNYEGDTNAISAEMFSYMYPSPERLIEFSNTIDGNGESFEKPIVLCEYGHAMGNGPGALEVYQTAFREHRRLQGGFIWEWANHGLWKGEHQKEFYAYGGDFGDIPNDRTFVMDGMCFSDHTPTPGLTEYKKVIEPVRSWLSGSTVIVGNGYDFISLDHLVATYKLEEFGKEYVYPQSPSRTLLITLRSGVLDSGELAIPEVRAGKRASTALPSQLFNQQSHEELWLTITFKLKGASTWADVGHEVAWMQSAIEFSQSLLRMPVLHPSISRPFQVNSSEKYYTITGDSFSFTFDHIRGTLSHWNSNGRSILLKHEATGSTIKPSFWSCPTDNDMPCQLGYWQQYSLDSLTSQLRSIEFSMSETSATVRASIYISPPILAWASMRLLPIPSTSREVSPKTYWPTSRIAAASRSRCSS
jgi:beta-galactosidase